MSKTTPEQRSFDAICACLKAQPIQDGVTHPAEPMLAAYIAQHGAVNAVGRFAGIGSANASADMMTLMGRSAAFDRDQKRIILHFALGSAHVAIRSAAIQAAENWCDAGLLDNLRAYSEPVSWLAEYKTEVIRDLSIITNSSSQSPSKLS